MKPASTTEVSRKGVQRKRKNTVARIRNGALRHMRGDEDDSREKGASISGFGTVGPDCVEERYVSFFGKV